MHIRSVSRVRPQMAFNIEQILDIVLQFINVIEAIERITGFDLEERINMFKGETEVA